MAKCTLTLQFSRNTDPLRLLAWLRQLIQDNFGLEDFSCWKGKSANSFEVELESKRDPSSEIRSKITRKSVSAVFYGDKSMLHIARDLMRRVGDEIEYADAWQRRAS